MTMNSHPAADLFPLMSDEEVASLAEDIKSQGLKHPIIRDGEGRILDGRNRFRACEIAGVEPEFVEANGDDPIALVVSLNVKRRNLSKSQTAIAAAEAWDQVGAKNGTKRRDVLADLFGTGREYVQRARSLIERDPDAAAEVKAGILTLGEAYDALRQRERQAEQRKEERGRLQRRPDLAELVEAGKLPTDDALLLIDREAREAEEARQRYRGYLKDALAFLDWPGGPDQQLEQAVEAAVDDSALSIERFKDASARCAAIADALSERGNAR